MLKRYLKFNNYRTLGASKEISDNRGNILELNATTKSDLISDKKYEKEEQFYYGGLVTIIGLNNTGKSNILDGLSSFSNGIKSSDNSSLVFDENNAASIEMVIKDTTESVEVRHIVDATGISSTCDGNFSTDVIEFDNNLFKDLKAEAVLARKAITDTVNSNIIEEVNVYIENLHVNNDITPSLFILNTEINKLKLYDKNIQKLYDFIGDKKYNHYLGEKNKIEQILGHVNKLKFCAMQDMANFRNIVNNAYSYSGISDLQGIINNWKTDRRFNSNNIVLISLDEVKSAIKFIDNIPNVRRNNYIVRLLDELKALENTQEQYYYSNNEFKFLDATHSDMDLVTYIIDLINSADSYVEDANLTSSDVKYLVRDINEIRSLYYSVEGMFEKALNVLLSELEDEDKKLGRIISKIEEVTKIPEKFLRLPNIYVFSDLQGMFSDSDLQISNLDGGNFGEILENSEFFKKLFSYIGLSNTYLENAYKKGSHSRQSLEKKLGKEMRKIENRFNKLYFSDISKNDKDLYKFGIRLESDNISMTMLQGEEDASLNQQSLGYRWFFSFFFKIMVESDILPGDIVVLDEVGVHLHPQSQIELRNIIKEYGIKKNITFVVTTHSPFFLDNDHLDEVRLITKTNGHTKIENQFDKFNNTDVITPITTAMAIESYIMQKSTDKVILVEGVTDYNILSGFKHLLSKEDDRFKHIIFVPIGGVGKSTHQKVSFICEKYPDSVVLLDSDDAGNNFAKLLQKSFKGTVKKLGDIHSEWIDLESVYGIKKGLQESVNFKINVMYKDVKLPNKTMQLSTKLFLELLDLKKNNVSSNQEVGKKQRAKKDTISQDKAA